MPALNDLYDKYKDRVEFYVVYIQEAHPVDLWQMSVNERENVLVNSTYTLADRSAAADACQLRLGIKMPAVVDKPDDAVEKAYTGWPDRLYLVGTDGKISYKSEAGPFGFEPEDLRAAIERAVNAN